MSAHLVDSELVTANDKWKGSYVSVTRQPSALMLIRLMLFNESEARGRREGEEKVKGEKEKGREKGR